MPIIAKATESTYKPAPAGLHRAICVDVVDKGLVTSKWEGEERTQHKVLIVWQIDEEDDETLRRFAVSRSYTLSLHEKATLRKDLESWRGRTFTGEELKGFDLEKLVGVSCQLNVIHNDRDGKTYANVASVLPLSKGQAKLDPDPGYVRQKDREPKGAVAVGITDEDVPF